MNRTQEDLSKKSPIDLMKELDLPVKDELLICRAFTHRSYLNEHPEALEDNERLEFLGDAVLDYVVGLWLYHHYPEMDEGDLTRLRAALVKTETLAEFATQIDVGSVLRLGRGEDENGGRGRNTLLCGAFEAFIGALSIDLGIDSVENFMEPFLKVATKEILQNQKDKDPKSLLQEWAQSRGQSIPSYKVLRESGPDHEKYFEVSVLIDNEFIARGEGRSKHTASMSAANNAIKELKIQ